MYDELVKRLRAQAVYMPEKFSKNAELLDVLMKAADAIEELTGFVQEAERDRDEYRERLDKANDTIEELQKRVPKVPHGRLIDADVLRCLYDPHDYGLDGEQADEYDRYHVSLPVIRQNIDDMPTIIPAEEGE